MLVVRMTRGREGLCRPACPSRASVARSRAGRPGSGARWCVPTGSHTGSAARFSAGAAGPLTSPWGLGVDLGDPLTPGPARAGGSRTKEETDLPQVHLPRRRPRPAAGHVLVSGGGAGVWRLEGSPGWVEGCRLTCGRGPYVGERAGLSADKNESLRIELNGFSTSPFWTFWRPLGHVKAALAREPYKIGQPPYLGDLARGREFGDPCSKVWPELETSRQGGAKPGPRMGREARDAYLLELCAVWGGRAGFLGSTP